MSRVKTLFMCLVMVGIADIASVILFDWESIGGQAALMVAFVATWVNE